MSASDPSRHAFEAAIIAFKNGLENEGTFNALLDNKTNINMVWDAISDIQEKQHSQGRLRNMAKIDAFLRRMEAYGSVIDTFVSAKADILALIWGPIRLLIVWTENATRLADAVMGAMAKIGDALPQSMDIINIFSDNEKLKQLLALFFRDILDFYVIALRLSSLSKRELAYEAVWPRQKGKIDVIISNIEQHTSLLRNQVTIEQIKEQFYFREQSLSNFEQQADSRDLQLFQALKMNFSPLAYGDVLDRLLKQSYPGTSDWLMKSKVFKHWLDISNRSTSLLWLKGIPGAGKTFLSGAAIEEAKTRHQTIFAFATYVNQNTTTAKSVLHSLLFQLADNNKFIRSSLVESSKQDLDSTKYVSQVFKTLLASIGPIYIIVDGLDEMEALERGILLQQLTSMTECPEVKILVSSRPEDDIANILETKSKNIRIDDNNGQGIRLYIKQKVEEWMEVAKFSREARGKIERLLIPIVANSNGMFLYARLVLDNVFELTEVNEIEEELKVLPTDLEDAYGRIFSRINAKKPILRRKARSLLGWMSCSPTRMTCLELEQALMISNDSRAPSVTTNVNFSRLCGPIIELVDDTPQFVHFTAKEYISSQQIEGFIDLAEANYTIAKNILMYLLSGLYDTGLDDQEIKENILEGRYRLHWFATNEWLAATNRCIKKLKDPSAHEDFSQLLLEAALELRNYNFTETVKTENILPSALNSPEISHIICGIAEFRQNEKQTEWSYSNAAMWLNYDPSTLSQMSVRIHDALEALLCDERKHRENGCQCATLKKHYGTRIFKCEFPSCDCSRKGFPTRRDLVLHVKHHNRPWKCSIPSCSYATIGFTTIRGSNEHWMKYHLKPKETIDLDRTELSSNDIEILFLELVKAGNISGLQQAASYFKSSHNSVAESATMYAAKIGSMPMLEILTQFIGPKGNAEDTEWLFDSQPMYRAVVRSENVEVFRWYLRQLTLKHEYGISHFRLFVAEATATDSPDVYSTWENFLLDPTLEVDKGYMGPESQASRSIPRHWKTSPIFSHPIFNAIKGNLFLECRLIQTWHRLNDSLDGNALSPLFLGWSLVELAQSNKCSLSLARELLNLGALIDFPQGKAVRNAAKKIPDYKKAYKGRTALHHASRRTSKESALFVRFLLENGANPCYGFAGSEPMHEKGVQHIKRWLGETWEEILKRTEHLRRGGTLKAPLEVGEVDVHETGSDTEPDEVTPKSKRPRLLH